MARKTNNTTIYSLSQELKVSPATVSKALSGSPELSAQMRQRIRELAQERNFKPRVTSRKVPNICVMIQQYKGHRLDFGMFLSTVMEGVAGYVQDEGLEMSIYADYVDNLNSCDVVRELRRRSVDGAVVLRANDESNYFQQLDDESFPYCALLSSAKGSPRSVITVNNEQVGKKATSYLIEKGHRNIGILVSPPGSVSGHHRLAGYKAALAEAGIAYNEKLVRYSSKDQTGLEFGTHAVQDILKKNRSVTAVFAMGYADSIGAVHGVRASGKSIPEDISVISCDDYPQLAYMSPALTVIDIPNCQLGYLAAKQVYRLIRNLEPIKIGKEIDLHGTLIERESVRSLR